MPKFAVAVSKERHCGGQQVTPAITITLSQSMRSFFRTCIKYRLRCLSVPVLLCPRVWTSLENGGVSSWPLGSPLEGTVLHYSCLPGFILIGRNSTQCNKMGKWDMPKPVCHCESLFSLYTLLQLFSSARQMYCFV